MKILITTHHRGIVGGLETYLQALIPALLKRGHQVAMVCDYPAGRDGATVDPKDGKLQVWWSEDLKPDSAVYSDLNRWGPDVIYAQKISPMGPDRMLQKRYPTVLYMHGYWGTCTTGRKCHAFPNIQACTRTFGPACLLMHYPKRCGGLNPVSAWKMFRDEQVRNSWLADYRAILVASTHMLSEIRRHGVSPEKSHIVRYPLTAATDPSPIFSKIPTGKLLFVGRLTDLKGADYLIRAIAPAESRLRQKLTLTVAGDGAELPKLQALARDQGVDATFVGWVDASRREEFMRRSDLLVVPSLWPEPFGLVGIEAGALGLPAVGYASGGITDWLLPGRTGELARADPPTAEGLADAIARALRDPEHYNRLCQGAWVLSNEYKLDRHVDELEAVLQTSMSVADADGLSSDGAKAEMELSGNGD